MTRRIVVTFMATAGLVLTLTGSRCTAPTSSSSSCTPYTVVKGDTLSAIATRHRGDSTISVRNYIVDIQVANNKSSDQVHVGEKLQIPPPGTSHC